MIESYSTINRRYRVDREIGAGGMAVVFRAHDLSLGRDVALKALRPQFAADPVFRSRFEREAAAAAGFSHPNIIKIYDVGVASDTPFFVMELIDGQTLKAIIREEAPFHPDDVAALLAQVGAALDYAHERGYVHRDIKPQNILVDGQGLARVVDFGIAKGVGDLDLTVEGTSLGSVHYLSPEQASGLMPTPASDIYSTGVVAYEMLTSHLPFTADSPVAVALRHIHDAPPAPSAVLPGLSLAVDAIVLTALAKDPTQRFHKASALATAMRSWREARPRPEQTAAAPPPGYPPSVPPPPPTNEPPAARAGDAGDGADQVHANGAAAGSPGCAPWLIGVAIAVILAALIVAGVQLSSRLGAPPGPGDPPPQSAPGMSASPAAVTPQATAGSGVAATPASQAGESGVPDLVGQTLPEAVDQARARGLALATAEPVFSDTIAVDAVAEQDPPAGAAAESAGTIYVKLSRGSATIELSALDLTGKPAAVAAATLRAAGFGVTETAVPSAAVPAGAVINSDPSGTATIGSTVTLQVSLGDVAIIPGRLQGEPAAVVTEELTAAGFEVAGETAVGRSSIEAAGLTLGAGGIEAGDVVGVQGDGVDFAAPLPRGTRVELVVYDPTLDATP